MDWTATYELRQQDPRAERFRTREHGFVGALATTCRDDANRLRFCRWVF